MKRTMPIPVNISIMEYKALLNRYDKYIQDANDEDKYSEGWYPVCINEFYDNEWLEAYREDWINQMEDSEKKSFEYIENSGQVCPTCKSENITADNYNEESAGRPVDCNDCGARWYEEYELTGIELEE